MDLDTERRAHALLMDSLDMSPADRTGFLRSACAGDAALLQRVVALLDAVEGAGDFLEVPAWGGAGVRGRGGAGEPEGVFSVEELAGRIPGYTPERLIASGGMACVYEARQARPPRPVALKVMRRGMRTEAAVQRFRFEGEVLARLEHPGIARIFEAGAFDDGHGASVPFYAMELVRDAMSLTGFADARGLGLEARLRLFAEVCDAVHHGHLLGVIHRDLKPGNILVDASGRPKVIDFGIARPSAAAQAWITQSLDRTHILGTLNYMSPEQCSGVARIDIRTDVYSLGVVLFELVTGRLPLDLSGLPVPAAMRAIERDTRPRPSAFNHDARGDLDAIVTHAMETEAGRRYQTVSDLGADVRRMLAHQPVQARPATTVYQLRKFARRHRAPVAAACVVVLALVAALGVVSRFAVLAERARVEAVRQQQRAEHEARVANEINGFWIDIIQRGSPYEARRADLQVREALDLAAPRVESGLAEPAVRARLHDAFAGAYQALGIWDAQLEHAEAAWRLRQPGGADPAERLRAGQALAAALLENNRLDEAEASASRALEALDADPTAPIAERPALLQTLARAADRAGDYERAERLFAESVAAARELLGDRHALTLVNTTMHAGVLIRLGRTGEALGLLAPTLAAQEDLLGPDHPDAIATLSTIARARQTLGQFDAAEADYGVLLQRAAGVLGPEHGYILLLRNNLASLLRDAGRLADAEAIFRAVLEVRSRVEGPDAPLTLQAALNLATALNDLDRPDEAEPLFRSVIEARTRVLGPDHPDTLNAMQSLGSLFVRHKRDEEAAGLYEQLLGRMRAALPQGNIRLAPALRNYALVLLGAERPAEALPLLIESHDILLAAAGPGHPQTLRGAEMVVGALERLDRPDELAAWRARVEAYQTPAP